VWTTKEHDEIDGRPLAVAETLSADG